MLVIRALGVSQGLVYLALGIAAWIALFKSGIQPEIIGLAMGLVTGAYAATRVDLERATELVRSFREQPTPELARSARLGVSAAISPNERAQALLHPWTSYVVVPIFALANAGLVIDEDLLGRAIRSPITIGIFVAYVVGKPVGIVATSWLASRASLNRLRPPVGWPVMAAGGALAGIGFTVSLLISSLAFTGERPRGGEARGARRGGRRVRARLAPLPRPGADPRVGEGALSWHARPGRSSTSRCRSTPRSTTCAGPTRPR